MSETYRIEAMPRTVLATRICMWIQAVLGFQQAGTFLVLMALGVRLDDGEGVALYSTALPLATVLLVGFLSTRVPSRRGWVRAAVLVVELLLIPLEIWEVLYGASLGNVVGLLLAAVVFVQLCRPSSGKWFDR
ncbi:hypothetical protein GCM10022419_023130 [Nonomuraea rosea]|uniref:Integral membrane protein n=1 Tax=Nonomuraea rosea TaxID=638574 RepID=A0ABP6VXF2_9ACTN